MTSQSLGSLTINRHVILLIAGNFSMSFLLGGIGCIGFICYFSFLFRTGLWFASPS